MSEDNRDINPWAERFNRYVEWFKANALNAGIALIIGYILGRIFH